MAVECDHAWDRRHFYGVSYPVSVTGCGALEGLGKGVPSLLISLSRYVVLIIPLAFIFSRFWGAAGVWHAFWVAEALTAIFAAIIYQRSVRE